MNQRNTTRQHLYWLVLLATLSGILVHIIRPEWSDVITPASTNSGNGTSKVSTNYSSVTHRRLLEEQTSSSQPLRILYTITTLAEYDNGNRATTKGDDRMQNVLIPVMKETVESLLEKGFHVDVFIVAHFKMTREHLLRQALPDSVGLKVWDEASPVSYDPGKRDDPKAKLKLNTLGLARQHRYVVKDNLFHYDFFMCFEDDMILHGSQVQNHLEMTQQLFRVRQNAPDKVDRKVIQEPDGELTASQLKRVFPGLIRVEVLLNEAEYGTQLHPDPVPIQDHPPVNAKPCCHLSNFSASNTRPAAPSSDKVFLWETNILALGVRHLPEIGYVALQRGPKPRDGEYNLTITDYWSGKDGYFGKEGRPAPGHFSFINNQGGWMGTRQQIWEWHTEICHGGFLPPFDSPHFHFDGLDARNVEWWSGGMGLFTPRHACNMYRIVSLDPSRFPSHLIYHSANNKQRQLSRDKKRFVKIDDFYGQLLTVRDNFARRVGLTTR